MTTYKELATANFTREIKDTNNDIIPVYIQTRGYVDDNEELQICSLKVSFHDKKHSLDLLNDAADELSTQFKEVRR